MTLMHSNLQVAKSGRRGRTAGGSARGKATGPPAERYAAHYIKKVRTSFDHAGGGVITHHRRLPSPPFRALMAGGWRLAASVQPRGGRWLAAGGCSLRQRMRTSRYTRTLSAPHRALACPAAHSLTHARTPAGPARAAPRQREPRAMSSGLVLNKARTKHCTPA